MTTEAPEISNNHGDNHFQSTHDDTSQINPTTEAPRNTLRLYNRLYPGRKGLFAPSDDSLAQYFITNPVPHKHATQWRPVIYRGDNPKYTPETTALALARRSAMWNSFKIWLGDGVDEVVKNEERKIKAKKYARKEKWRKAFGVSSKPPKEPLEEQQPVKGLVVLFQMKRKGNLRRVEFEIGGIAYRWTGTRRFETGFMKRVKGWSHCMKVGIHMSQFPRTVSSTTNSHNEILTYSQLVRISDHALIATLEKSRASSYRSSIKSAGPPNKKKQFTGTLRLYDEAYSTTCVKSNTDLSIPAEVTPEVSAFASNALSSKFKDEKGFNLNGPHAGNVIEDAIIISCWVVVEAEHRLRYKILDFLEEVGENAEGG
ncbi:hypothetical protein FQN51_000619 [Onygenales sp. PD_10]|nr:hypothetical protein FQN51_000619 [Onygenales sp. PD_10]